MIITIGITNILMIIIILIMVKTCMELRMWSSPADMRLLACWSTD